MYSILQYYGMFNLKKKRIHSLFYFQPQNQVRQTFH